MVRHVLRTCARWLGRDVRHEAASSALVARATGERALAVTSAQPDLCGWRASGCPPAPRSSPAASPTDLSRDAMIYGRRFASSPESDKAAPGDAAAGADQEPQGGPARERPERGLDGGPPPIPWSSDGKTFDITAEEMEQYILQDLDGYRRRLQGWDAEHRFPQIYTVRVVLKGPDEEALQENVDNVLRAAQVACSPRPRHSKRKPKRKLVTVPRATFKYKKEGMEQFWIVERTHEVSVTFGTERMLKFFLHLLRHMRWYDVDDVMCNVRYKVDLEDLLAVDVGPLEDDGPETSEPATTTPQEAGKAAE